MQGVPFGLKPSRPTGPRIPLGAQRLLRPLLAAVLGALLALAALLFVTEVVAFSGWSYAYSLARPELLEHTGLDLGQVRGLMMHVLRYAGGGSGEFQVLFPPGHPLAGQPVFTQREVDHMADVRLLFARGRAVRWAAVGVLGVAPALTWLGGGRGRGQGREALFRGSSQTALWAAGWGTGLFALVGVALTAGFSLAFDWFHFLLFDNDLWQLPEESMLITLLPLEQFQRIGVLIGAGFAICLVFFVILGRVLARRGSYS